VKTSGPGLRVRDLIAHPDERGFVAEVMREDWPEVSDVTGFPQATISWSYPGVIRAWHRHQRGQIDYVVVLQGTVQICTYDDRPNSSSTGSLGQVVVSGQRLQAVRIEAGYWHGTKALGDVPTLTLYLVTRLYDYSDPDEERRPWDDPSVIDPGSGKPFDWNKDLLPKKGNPANKLPSHRVDDRPKSRSRSTKKIES
jgi:dTDP-4-dehydrorhamnose 3,5-epimerase